jgi:hypothetical protein
MSPPIALDTNLLLRGAYRLPREAIISAMKGLLKIRQLHLLRSEGCSALLSFDRAFGRQSGELGCNPVVREP